MIFTITNLYDQVLFVDGRRVEPGNFIKVDRSALSAELLDLQTKNRIKIDPPISSDVMSGAIAIGFGTGIDSDRLTYNGVAFGPHLTGPAGVINDYLHNQVAPNVFWEIHHNLGRRVSVTVWDTAGSEVLGDVLYVSDNVVHLNFAMPFSGTARCV